MIFWTHLRRQNLFIISKQLPKSKDHPEQATSTVYLGNFRFLVTLLTTQVDYKQKISENCQ